MVWLSGIIVKASDLQPSGCRFESRLLLGDDSVQVVHTHVPQYNLVPV